MQGRYTPLHCAIMNKHEKIVEQLLKAFASHSPHPCTSNILKSYEIKKMTGHYSCSHLTVRAHLTSLIAHFQLKLKKRTYQSIVYFWKQECGQMSQPL